MTSNRAQNDGSCRRLVVSTRQVTGADPEKIWGNKPRYNELILTVPIHNLPRYNEYFVLSLAVGKMV